MSYLIYQAYGNKAIFDECIYSIHTFALYHPHNEIIKILIYTDDKSYFQKYINLPYVSYETITEAQILQWKGKIDFVHRAKIEIIKHCLTKYQSSILYLDTDTFFTASSVVIIKQISLQTSVMHTNEGIISEPINPIFKKLKAFLSTFEIDDNGKKFQIPVSTSMWNAGAIGIHSNALKWCDEILLITDQTYAAYQKHVMEQMAVSYVLQTHSQIIPIEQAVHHYWKEKENYRTAIKEWLNVIGKDAIGNRQTPEIDKSKFITEKKTFWQKLFSK